MQVPDIRKNILLQSGYAVPKKSNKSIKKNSCQTTQMSYKLHHKWQNILADVTKYSLYGLETRPHPIKSYAKLKSKYVKAKC